MLTIAGAARRSYLFPAGLAKTFAYHRDVDRLIGFLPHITVIRKEGGGRFRLLYSAEEARIYRVRIFCDVVVAADPDRPSVRIAAARPAQPAAFGAGFNSMTGSGEFTERIVFKDAGEQTRIECSIGIRAVLPVALSLRLVPRAPLQAAADRIFRKRLDEILACFVDRSIRDYSR